MSSSLIQFSTSMRGWFKPLAVKLLGGVLDIYARKSYSQEGEDLILAGSSQVRREVSMWMSVRIILAVSQTHGYFILDQSSAAANTTVCEL